MTTEEKQLLLKDLCARLSYGVKVLNTAEGLNKICKLDSIMTARNGKDCFVGLTLPDDSIMTGIEMVKPYLRPMSSMTEEEKRKFQSFFPGCFGDQWLDIEEGIIEIFECSSTMTLYLYDFERMIDWLNAHHFDYRGLIEKNLALDCTGLHIYD